MGQVVIEVPQNVYRSYHVDDSEFSEQLMRDLDKNSSSMEINSAIIPPRRNSLKEDPAKAFGIWMDHPEGAEEIERGIRDRNNGNEFKTISLEYPYDLDDVDETEAIGIWADRKESAQEIARTIREKNRNRKGTSAGF